MIILPHRRKAFRSGGGAFTDPTDIAGLQLWLDASDSATLFNATSGGSLPANGGGVKRWEDKSGNSRHFTIDGAEPSRDVAAINSKDAIRFPVGGLKYLTNSTNFMIGSTNGAMFGVVKYDSDPPTYGGHFCSFPSDFYGLYSFGSDGNWYEGFGVGTRKSLGNPTPDFSTQKVVSIRSQSSLWDMHIDGSSFYTTGTNTVSWTSGDIWIGAGGNSSYAITGGHVCEIIVYNSAVDDADREAVESYLMAKWGI